MITAPQITKRLGVTKGLKSVTADDLTKMETIRKKAMRGAPIDAEDQKWMTRTLIDALTFRNTVYDLWIDDDTNTIARLESGMEPAKTEPQVEIADAPVDEPVPDGIPEEATPADIAEAADELEIEEGDILETAPVDEAEPESMDKVHAVLDALN